MSTCGSLWTMYRNIELIRFGKPTTSKDTSVPDTIYLNLSGAIKLVRYKIRGTCQRFLYILICSSHTHTLRSFSPTFLLDPANSRHVTLSTSHSCSRVYTKRSIIPGCVGWGVCALSRRRNRCMCASLGSVALLQRQSIR